MPPHGEIQPLRAFILPALVLLYAQQREPAARVSALQPAVGLCAGPRRSGTHTCVKVHDQHKPAATRCSHVLGGPMCASWERRGRRQRGGGMGALAVAPGHGEGEGHDQKGAVLGPGVAGADLGPNSSQ